MDQFFPSWLAKLFEWLANTWLGKFFEWLLGSAKVDIPPSVRGFVLAGLIIWVVLFAVYYSVMILLYVVRGWRAKSPDATGRWATTAELKRRFVLLTPVKYFILFKLPLLLGIGLFVYLLITPSSSISVYIPMAIIAIGGVLLINSDYKLYRNKAMPYPLGEHKSLKTCLIGGFRKSIFHGTAKDQRQEHVLIIGPTGSGKTTAYFIPPLLEDASGNCSAIVVEVKNTGDKKDDLLRVIGPSWVESGKKILVFDPWTGNNTLHFNPILGLEPDIANGATRETIDEIVDAIYRTSAEISGSPSSDGAYHESNEKVLLRGLIYISLFKPESQRNITAIRQIVGGDVESVVRYINSAAIPTDPKLTEFIVNELKWFTAPDNIRTDMKANTLRGIANKLDIFSHPKVKACTVHNNLDLDIIFKERCLLIIKSPLDVIGANILASIIIRLLQLRSHRKISYGAGEDFKVWFYLDELPTLCLPELSKFVATARSAGVGVIAAVQDKADLSSSIVVKRGTNSIESLIGNLKTKIILPGCSPEMSEYFSKAWGVQSVEAMTQTRDVFEVVSYRYMKTEKQAKLISADAIYKMDPTKAIIDAGNARPFIIDMVPWYKSSKYKKMVENNLQNKVEFYTPEGKVIEYQSPVIPQFDTTNVKKIAQKIVNMDETSSAETHPGVFDVSNQATDMQNTTQPAHIEAPLQDERENQYFAIVSEPPQHHHDHSDDTSRDM